MYRFKGSVPTFNDLPKENNEIGDVYDVLDTDDNYAWTGSKWDKLSSTTDLSNYVTKDEIKDVVKYKEFIKDENDGIRKTIQLENNDTISGITTTGEGANLVMLSKWDVADFGSPITHSNINTKTKFGNASVVTVNDNEALITDKLLQILLSNNGNVKAIVSEIEVDGKKFNLYDLNVDLSEYAKTKELKKELENKADKSELDNVVKLEQLTNRKVIKLDKNDALMSDGKLLAFVNDYGVIELGGTNAHTNISTQTKFGDDYVVTINDDAVIVTDKLLSTLLTNEGNVKISSNEIEVDGKKFNLYNLNVDLSEYAKKEDIKVDLPIASNETLGGVKVGDGLKINDEGLLSVNIGSGIVSSVNNKTGDVELKANDIMYKDQTIAEVLDELLYIEPKVDIKGGGSFELGSSNNITLTWSINKDIVSQNLSNIGDLDPSIREYNLSGINSNNTYKITVNDGKNTASDSVNVNFMNRRFWGVTELETLSNDDIMNLNSELSNSRTQTRTFDCTGGKYFYFAIPTSLCNGISFKVGGLSFSGMEVQTIKFTNQYGFVNNYNIYRSGNIQTGSSIQVQVL